MNSLNYFNIYGHDAGFPGSNAANFIFFEMPKILPWFYDLSFKARKQKFATFEAQR